MKKVQYHSIKHFIAVKALNFKTDNCRLIKLILGAELYLIKS